MADTVEPLTEQVPGIVPQPMPGAAPAPNLPRPRGVAGPRPSPSGAGAASGATSAPTGRSSLFSILFWVSLFAEFIANNRPILLSYRGELRMPVFTLYSERAFNGDFPSEAAYTDIEVQCLIETGGLEDCFDDPEGMIEQARAGTIEDPEFHKGWMVWPLIPYKYNTIVDVRASRPRLPTVTTGWGLTTPSATCSRA
jgi:microcin C transport system permease protein